MQAIELMIAIPSQMEAGHIHQPGDRGILVEHLGPDASIIEIRVKDESLEGLAWYETFAVKNEEFKLVDGESDERA